MALVQDWIRQIGTPALEGALGISVDDRGNVFITGYSGGDLSTGRAEDDSKAFIAKYDAFGEQQWVTQIGTDVDDEGNAVAVDSNGNIFVIGHTFGDDSSDSSSEFVVTWLAKFNPAGSLLWKKRLFKQPDDRSRSIAIDSENHVVLAGITFWREGQDGPADGGADAWIAKFDGEGNQIWYDRIQSSAYEGAFGVAVDGQNQIYAGGITYGDLEAAQHQGQGDAWLAKYGPSGDRIWLKQTGTDKEDFIKAVAVDPKGFPVVTGLTYGDLGEEGEQGDGDGFVARFNPESGDLLWLHQFGTSSYDNPRGIATDGFGNVYVAGFTFGELEPGARQGEGDAWVGKWDAAGAQEWMVQLGSDKFDEATGIAVDDQGRIYLCGVTRGVLEQGAEGGSFDAWLARYSDSEGDNQLLGLLLQLQQRLNELEIHVSALDGQLGMIEEKLGMVLEKLSGAGPDQELVQAAELRIQGRGDGRISLEDAEEIWEIAYEGGILTEREKQTLFYLMEHFKFTEKAEEFMREKLDGVE